jgi:signal transduction histidine kinase
MGLENILYKMLHDDLTNDYLNSKVNVLFEDINRIKKIIEHVRTFSRDQQNASVELLKVDEVVKNAVSLINRQYLNHQVDLIVEIPDGEYFTLGNPFRLEQVFLNILSNAKAAVDKRFNNKDEGYKKVIKLTMKKDDEFIFIDISDNGVGIPKEITDKIFEPFFTTKDKQSGTGLGLSISYGIIKEMNGEIMVESTPSSCTKLRVQLPITKS